MVSRVISSIGESSSSDNGKKWTVGTPDDAPQRDPYGFEIRDERSIPQGQQIDPAAVQAMRTRYQQKEQQEVFNSTQNARRRVDMITGIGRKTKDVPVPGEQSVITIRTLKFNEKRLVSAVIEGAERIVVDGKAMITHTGVQDIEKEAVTHSLFLIDGQPIDVILNTSHLDDREQLLAKRELVDSMDYLLIDHLYKKYEELNKEASDGYSPNTPEEAKEVVDTIRKSGPDTGS